MEFGKGESRLFEGLSRGTRLHAGVLYNSQRFRVGNVTGHAFVTQVCIPFNLISKIENEGFGSDHCELG